ncbi:uncharacterized protein LOC107803533 isoform X2 [Nicotiana tabacum]|uniref:Uncharacterized protein LOC107803533 isoform X2 n=2 Tax=Nicotiana TaxID=4085 RepID=A0AC58U895_TOBAC
MKSLGLPLIDIWRINLECSRLFFLIKEGANNSMSFSACIVICLTTSSMQEEWRIHMLPIEFLFITVWPVIDMRLRCKSEGVEYPPGIPPDASKVLELDIIRWELQGLDDALKPSQFSLGVKGSLYPDRNGPRSRLKGQLQMSISFVLPPMLALVPEDVRRDVADTVLRGLLQNMKNKVNGSLLSDYGEFKREKQKELV